MLDISICTARTRYTAKDAAKAIISSKYIGHGSPDSSTNAYAEAIGPPNSNCGIYGPLDTVWISAEGNRRGRIEPDFAEIGRACAARAWIITDNPFHRARSYDVGERQVAAFLIENGYFETRPGCWTHPDRLKRSAIKGAADHEA